MDCNGKKKSILFIKLNFCPRKSILVIRDQAKQYLLKGSGPCPHAPRLGPPPSPHKVPSPKPVLKKSRVTIWGARQRRSARSLPGISPSRGEYAPACTSRQDGRMVLQRRQVAQRTPYLAHTHTPANLLLAWLLLHLRALASTCA